MRQGEEPSCLIATAWDVVSGLASNLGPQISCLHSDPLLGPLKPGETVTRHGRIWLGQWTLDELHGLYEEFLTGSTLGSVDPMGPRIG